MRPHPATVDDVVAALRAGGLACFPTETLWALAARADDPAAVRLLFEVKRRPQGVPLAAAFPSWEAARPHFQATPLAEALAQRFLPGPLSIVLARAGPALAHLAPGLGTLSVRVPDHPVAQEALRRAGPLAMTSANRHGEADPRTQDEVLRALSGPSPPGDLPVAGGTVGGRGSTVVDATGEAPRVLREGVIGAGEVARAWP